MDQGQAAAFAGALDRPPTSSWEIINPREYEKKHVPPCPSSLTSIPSSTPSTSPTTSARSASSISKFSLKSSVAKPPHATSLPRGTAASIGPASGSTQKLPQNRPAPNLSLSSICPPGRTPHPRRSSPTSTPITSAANTPASSPTCRPAHHPRRRSKSRSSPPPKAPSSSPPVANSSSSPKAFDLDLARKLTALILDAQGTGELKMADTNYPTTLHPASCHPERTPNFDSHPERPKGVEEPVSCTVSTATTSETLEPLTSNLVRFFSSCGVMKAVVQADLGAAKAK
jgi:hypothetical protein